MQTEKSLNALALYMFADVGARGECLPSSNSKSKYFFSYLSTQRELEHAFFVSRDVVVADFSHFARALDHLSDII
jgi:hypothetical protein